MGKIKHPFSLIFFRWVGEKTPTSESVHNGSDFHLVRPHDIMEVTENAGQRYVWEKVLFDCFNGLQVRWNSDLPKSATLLPRLGQGSMGFVPNVVPPQHHPRFSKPQGLAIAKKEAARFSRLAYEARMEWLNQPDWWIVGTMAVMMIMMTTTMTIMTVMKMNLNHTQVIQRDLSSSPSWRSLNLWKGHKELPGPYKLMCF